jgi:hypothetical protein
VPPVTLGAKSMLSSHGKANKKAKKFKKNIFKFKFQT